MGYRYKIFIQKQFRNADKIFPLQQKYVAALVDGLKKNNHVNKIIIFGSSLTPVCHIDSDIDVYLDLNEDVKVDFPFINRPYDYWNNYTADESLKEEIKRSGVIVYEKNKDIS